MIKTNEEKAAYQLAWRLKHPGYYLSLKEQKGFSKCIVCKNKVPPTRTKYCSYKCSQDALYGVIYPKEK